MRSHPPAILVVDDEASIRRVLSTRLSKIGYQVYTAADGVEALDVFYDQRPDLIILDVMMPKLDGYGVCQAVRKASRVPIIMLTALSDVVDRITGLEMGADDYVVKPFSLKELESRVRSILRRMETTKPLPFHHQSNGVIRFGSITVDTNKRQVFKGRSRISLTHMEFSVLELLATHPGEPISRSEFLHKVWGYSHEANVDTQVVDIHISHLRRKLGDSSGNPKLIHTVHGVGYTLKP
ncbi:response regulator transcription factor RpaB [Acaryochloris marina]|uniref:Probable transcriptional regulator ycf27 n=1 Tax=Acaryochloris marina (strain MBIC 11017) TaxID=329726 RepID=A8ZMJ8_ACAM1|nr:response regulator [Acaryochloris marina]ABW32409.1 two-component transcriptional regulator [Acaryochloris marina MBIC11017]